MGAKFSSGGGATVFYDKTDTPGEIVTELVNASDGAGLHFDGNGVVAFTPVDLGSKFSHEFVLSTSEDLTTGTSSYIIDYHRSSGDPVTTDRFILGFNPSEDSGNLAIYDNTGWESFGVNPLTDRKIHHLVVTVDGTSAKLYDNGNQVGTATISASHGIDGTTNAGLAGYYNNSNQFEGTIYRARSYNKALEPDEVRTAYERADVDFADQYGSASNIVSGYNFSGWSTGNSSNVDTTTQNITGSGGWWKKEYSLNAGFKHRIRIAGTQATTDFFLRTFALGGVTLSNIEATAGTLNSAGLVGGATFDVTAEITPTSNGFGFQGGAGTGEIELTTFEVHQIGCISDYDLAYAQPALSTLIQDRSNAADGVASSSGVTQVQPITQLNSTSARIGSTQLAAGTAPYIPADGELSAGSVTVGKLTDNNTGKLDYSSGSGNLDLNAYSRGGSTAIRLSTSDSGTNATRLTVASDGNVRIGNQTSNIDNLLKLDVANGNDVFLGIRQADQIQWHIGQKASDTSLYFRSGNVGSETDHLTIDSTGNVGINCDNPTVGQLQIDQSSGSTLALTRTAGATTGTLGLVRFGNTNVDSNLANILVYQDNATDAAAIAFQTQPTGGDAATRLTIDSTGLATFSNGIAFQSATTGSGTGTGYTLDKFETGTWTMAWSFSTSGSATLSSTTAYYTRIGNIVTVWGGAITSGISSPSGNAKITGLPFANSNVDYCGFSIGRLSRWGTDFSYFRGMIEGQSINFEVNATNGTSGTRLQGSDFSGTANYNQIYFSGTYRVA